MLEPRVIRGGTIRPENSSKVWLNTFCDLSRLSTALSRVTPARPAWIAAGAIPFDAASFLKSSSHASNVPLPQGADIAGAAEVRTNAAKAIAGRDRRGVKKRKFMRPCAPKPTRNPSHHRH